MRGWFPRNNERTLSSSSGRQSESNQDALIVATYGVSTSSPEARTPNGALLVNETNRASHRPRMKRSLFLSQVSHSLNKLLEKASPESLRNE